MFCKEVRGRGYKVSPTDHYICCNNKECERLFSYTVNLWYLENHELCPFNVTKYPHRIYRKKTDTIIECIDINRRIIRFIHGRPTMYIMFHEDVEKSKMEDLSSLIRYNREIFGKCFEEGFNNVFIIPHYLDERIIDMWMSRIRRAYEKA